MSHFLVNNLFIFLKKKNPHTKKKKKILHFTVNFLTSCSPRTMCGCVREAVDIQPQSPIHQEGTAGVRWENCAVKHTWIFCCSPAQQIPIPKGDKKLQKLLALVPHADLGLALVIPFRLQLHAWLQREHLCCSLGNTATLFLKLHPKLL